MKEELLLKCFIETMKLKLAPGENLATYLMRILPLGREAVYRRLRGDVPFTFEEVAVISQHLRLSLNALVGKGDSEFVPFYFTRSSMVSEEDQRAGKEREALEVKQLIDKARASRDPISEAGIALNMLPAAFMMRYSCLLKFRVFKWLYQSNGGNNVQPYDKVNVPEKLLRYSVDSYLALARINSIYLILDKMIFAYMVNDIRSFAMVDLLSREEVELIRQDLLALINELERTTVTGQNVLGNKLDIFLSDINFESTYIYTSSSSGTSCAIGIFSMSSLYSLDNDMFHAVKNWVDSLKQLSFLVTGAGEVYRKQFFKKQRELVESL
jgi:hypothetical protein